MGTLVLIIICCFIPPLAVFLIDGIGKRFWINLILTFLGFLPGFVHGLYVILTDEG